MFRVPLNDSVRHFSPELRILYLFGIYFHELLLAKLYIFLLKVKKILSVLDRHKIPNRVKISENKMKNYGKYILGIKYIHKSESLVKNNKPQRKWKF